MSPVRVLTLTVNLCGQRISRGTSLVSIARLSPLLDASRETFLNGLWSLYILHKTCGQEKMQQSIDLTSAYINYSYFGIHCM